MVELGSLEGRSVDERLVGFGVLARVRARTTRSRRLVNRRSLRVRSSGVKTSSSRPDINSLASVLASNLSVLAFASLIDLSLRVLATTTRTP
jgi:hypothetical protein